MDLDEAGVISLDMIGRSIFLQQQRQLVVQHHFPQFPVGVITEKPMSMERRMRKSLMGVDIIKVCSPAEYTRGGITKDAAADSSAFFMKRSMIPSSSFLSIGFSK